MKKLLIVLLAVFAILLCSCGKTPEEPPVVDGPFLPDVALWGDAVEQDNQKFLLSDIYPGITLGELIDVLGKGAAPASRSSTEPPIYLWNIGDRGVLRVTFSMDEINEYRTKLHNNEFVLPGETLDYDENTGFHTITENELREYVKALLRSKAEDAYVLEKGDAKFNWGDDFITETLFEKEPE